MPIAKKLMTLREKKTPTADRVQTASKQHPSGN
jgi:hypothetical protein